MFINTFFRRVLFNFAILFVFLSLSFFLFFPVYTSDTIMITFAINPFNLCEKYPDFWKALKLLYFPISIISYLILINTLYSSLFTKPFIKQSSKKIDKNTLSLFITKDQHGNSIILPENSLYQNILITGTIGSGKTSSAMYPFTRQFIRYHYDNASSKLGMLILDVKGNYYKQVQKYASFYRREDDLIVIELRRKY